MESIAERNRRYPTGNSFSAHLRQLVFAAESSAEHALTISTAAVHGEFHVLCGEPSQEESEMYIEDDWDRASGTSEAIIRLFAAFFSHPSIHPEVAPAWCSDWGFHCMWRSVLHRRCSPEYSVRCYGYALDCARGLSSTPAGAAAFVRLLGGYTYYPKDAVQGLFLLPYTMMQAGTNIKDVMAAPVKQDAVTILRGARACRDLLLHSTAPLPQLECFTEEGNMGAPLNEQQKQALKDYMVCVEHQQFVSAVFVSILRLVHNALSMTHGAVLGAGGVRGGVNCCGTKIWAMMPCAVPWWVARLCSTASMPLVGQNGSVGSSLPTP